MANANGGVIYIGKDDKGKVLGINNAVKLVKEIPNKIKDTMGIIPEVKIVKENELLYVIIRIEQYPMPISYQGKFYLRSGSNNHQVTGSELDRFMLDRVVDLIYLKYLKGLIHYKGMQRIDEYMFPRERI